MAVTEDRKRETTRTETRRMNVSALPSRNLDPNSIKHHKNAIVQGTASHGVKTNIHTLCITALQTDAPDAIITK